MIRLQAGTYELMEEHRNGWNQEAFKERYSDILDKYDYIVGDWGYGQLRLRGFFDNANRKVPFEQKIATLDEYIQEFCNFGCAYFVLKRTKIGQGISEFSSNLDEKPTESENIGETSQETQSQRVESPQRYPRRHERNERINHNSGKDRGERPTRFDKNRNSRGEQRERSGEKPPRNRNSSHQSNRFQRDKVPTNVTTEMPKNPSK